MKKITVWGVLFLVVAGIIASAGCTTTTTDTSTDPVVGIWAVDVTPNTYAEFDPEFAEVVEDSRDEGYSIYAVNQAYAFNENNEAKYYFYLKTSIGTILLELPYNYTWKNNGSNNYTLTNKSTGEVLEFNVNPKNESMKIVDNDEEDDYDIDAFTFRKINSITMIDLESLF